MITERYDVIIYGSTMDAGEEYYKNYYKDY